LGFVCWSRFIRGKVTKIKPNYSPQNPNIQKQRRDRKVRENNGRK
jgi:hypothetical protein